LLFDAISISSACHSLPHTEMQTVVLYLCSLYWTAVWKRKTNGAMCL